MLPGYVETILIALFGKMGDQWVKHHIVLAFNIINLYYVKV